MCKYLAAVVLLVAVNGALAAAPALDDPTRPSDGHGARAVPGWPQLQLQGIVCRGHSRIAIIDGRLIHSGDHLGDALIGEIEADAVHYQRDGHQLVAYLTKSTLQVRRVIAPPKDAP